MDPSTNAPPSPVSPMSEKTVQATRPKTQSSGRSKSYISCRTSTGIPRNSFITISSQNITVFADIKDLPSRSGSQRSGAEEVDIPLKVVTTELEIKRQSYASIASISSFGFDVAVPEPVYNGDQSFVEGRTNQKVAMRQQFGRQESFRCLWRMKSFRKNQHGLNEPSSQPPSKSLLNFATVFPTVPPDKQPVYVEKSLPPPPYHAFGATKKKWIMYLMALVAVLTPVSAIIYFPVLGDISRVSAPSPVSIPQLRSLGISLESRVCFTHSCCTYGSSRHRAADLYASRRLPWSTICSHCHTGRLRSCQCRISFLK